MQVGQVTLRSALARLEAEKLVERVRGRGTFVSDASRRRTFLLLQPDGADTTASSSRYIAEGLASAAEKKSVVIERCPAGLFMSFSAEECRWMIFRNRISGIVLDSGHSRVDPLMIERIKSFNLPVVIPHGLPHDAERSGFLVLRTNEREAFADGLRMLRDFGHRRIAFLRIKLPGEDVADIRGFSDRELSDFYREISLEPDDELLVTAGCAANEIAETVKNWMNSSEPPTAIMCHSDNIAMRVCLVLKQLGIKIPGQLSVMGYCNYPGAQLMLPALSTIDVHFHECGELALQQLLCADKWFRPGVTPGEIFTPHTIINRESVAVLKNPR